MSYPAMSTLINFLTLFVLILTLYCVRKYTLVTHAIYAASYQPSIVLQITQDNPRAGTPNIRGFSFHNIGVGPAFDVKMKQWKKDDWLVEWDDPPGVLEKGHSTKAVFFVSRGGKSGGFARDYLDLGSVLSDNPLRTLDTLQMPFEITYRDLAGSIHVTCGNLECAVASGVVRDRYISLV